MPSVFRLTFITLLLFSQALQAIQDAPDSQNDKSVSTEKHTGTVMNGFSMKSFENFNNKWKMVTVRFRKDTSEMRIVYANPLAWKTLSSGKINYPDGAVFGKIGIVTKDDPEFVSSEVPSGARRYQFMVRDSKKFAETDGWGYVLFDSNGSLYPEEVHKQEIACAACHRMVKESRGAVFSQIMALNQGSGQFAVKSEEPKISKNLKFEEADVDGLPKAIIDLLPPSTRKVNLLVGEIQDALFQGTLDEIKPMLTMQTILNKNPSLIMDRDQKRYSLVFLNSEDAACAAKGQHAFIVINSQLGTKPHNISHFCHE